MSSLTSLFPQYLHTSCLTLELFSRTPEHYACLLASMNSPTSHESMGDFGIRTPGQFDAFGSVARLYDSRFLNGIADADAYYLLHLGSHNPEGELMGGISLCQRVAKSGGGSVLIPPDIGWSLLEKFHGKGFATKVAREVLHFATEEFGYDRVVVFPNEKNKQSNRVAEKLGFVDGGQCPDRGEPGRIYSVPVWRGCRRLMRLLRMGSA